MQPVNLSDFNMLLSHRHLHPRNRTKWIYFCDECKTPPKFGVYICVKHGKSKSYCLSCCFSKYGYFCHCEDPEEIKRLKTTVTPEKDVVAESNKHLHVGKDNPLIKIASEELQSVMETVLAPMPNSEEAKEKKGQTATVHAMYIPDTEELQN